MSFLYLTHEPDSTESRIADVLRSRGHAIEFRCHAAGDPLPEATAFDGVIVGGGTISVWQTEHAFMTRQIEFVREVVDAGVPYVGFCVGSQILAAAFGVTSAERPDRKSEHGFYPIQVTPAGQAVFGSLDHVYEMHYESSVSVPAGGELLATSEWFPVQAFRMGSHTYGLQFHPDAREDMVGSWWHANPQYHGRDGVQPLDTQLAALAKRYEQSIQSWAERFIDEWLRGVGAKPWVEAAGGIVMTDWLRNGRLADGSKVDIAVDDGLITNVYDAENIRKGGTDLQGWLVLAAMAEPHAHLDKALTADMIPNPTGDLGGAIEAWIVAASAGKITHEGIVERAAAAMERLLVHGVTAVRTHVNVMATIGASSVVAVREAADRFAGLLDVQVVALCGSPLTGSEGAGTRAALAQALEFGVDFVGGCPHLDPDPLALIDVVLDAARDAGIGIDLHVDEMLDPAVLTLRDYARRVIETGFEGLVAASHCVTLGMQTPAVQAAVAREVAQAGIAVFPLPQTNLFLQGRDDPTATPRGLTAVRALQDAGALVAAGADNVQDPFNLVGRSDPLETAALMVMVGHQMPETAYDMVSNNVRRAIGLAEVNIEPGDPADLVAIDAPTIRGAIADAPMSRRVFRRGKLVASADQHTTIHRPV